MDFPKLNVAVTVRVKTGNRVLPTKRNLNFHQISKLAIFKGLC
jgi:hypothetical protein